ncbi:hypothetical protein [Neomoorella thermoacetica]|uniref:hypothetical protein n=1 Tax=Neomoorella thermoacetica TaxID=1525 RepID=UPI0008FA02BD|nr:hypothetical protein [Moorella thermoacetica]OIQ11266.1 hypothetical protein MOOTH_18410 [Moorella thermoacetica]
MDFMPWTALVFQSIPEEIIQVALGLGLIGRYPRMRFITAIGIGGGVFSFFFRRLPFDFGVHTLAQLIVLILLLHFIVRVDYFEATMAAFLGVLAVGIVEGISIPTVSYLTGISFETALHDPWLRVLFPIPDEIILGAAAYLCRRWRLSLVFSRSLLENRDRKEQ